MFSVEFNCYRAEPAITFFWSVMSGRDRRLLFSFDYIWQSSPAAGPSYFSFLGDGTPWLQPVCDSGYKVVKITFKTAACQEKQAAL
ncbi:MAG: hypothetical protein MI862_29920, partial [Desulfobacterales bacterium]|nr:hypothetical protein [Desulfobacterales bacterium]